MKTTHFLTLAALAAFCSLLSTASFATTVVQAWVSSGGNAVGTDAKGNVFVTGQEYVGGASRIHTAKYAGASGALLWERLYTGAAAGEAPSALIVDAGGNVAVTGSVASAGGQTDYYTAKYRGGDGGLIWESRFHGTANGANAASAITLDQAGNIIVAGTSAGAGCVTVKYAQGTGALLWKKSVLGVSPVALAVDPTGNVVITGTLSNPHNQDIYTAKYARTSGALLWNRTYDSGGSEDLAGAVAVDSAGNVITTGVIGYSTSFGFAGLTIKYASATGATIWQRTGENRYGSGVAIDAAGNAIVSSYSGGGEGTGDGAAVKYASANGATLWTCSLPDFAAEAVVLDSQGNATVAGYSAVRGDGAEGYTVNMHVARVAGADGTLLWEASTSSDSLGRQPVALTPDGGAVLIGDVTVKYRSTP